MRQNKVKCVYDACCHSNVNLVTTRQPTQQCMINLNFHMITDNKMMMMIILSYNNIIIVLFYATTNNDI